MFHLKRDKFIKISKIDQILYMYYFPDTFAAHSIELVHTPISKLLPRSVER